jgi:chromosome segregation ATPase
MTLRGVTLVAALLSLGAAGLVAGQGLGDAAARERARRAKGNTEKRKDAAPAYTNSDLDAISPPEEESESEGEEAASETSSARRAPQRPRPSGSVRGRDDALRSYRDDVSAAQAQVDRIETRIRELNGKLNPMSRDYIYGAAQSGDAAGEELRVRAELNDLEEQLADARRDLANATEALNAAQEGRQPSFTSAEPR